MIATNLYQLSKGVSIPFGRFPFSISNLIFSSLVFSSLFFATRVSSAQTGSFSDPKENFEFVVGLLKEKYGGSKLTEEEIYRAATEGLLEKINPNTEWDELLSPKEYRFVMENLQSSMVGIGVDISFKTETGHAKVLQTYPKTAAAIGGIQKDDLILSVEGKSFKGKEFKEIVQSIRGPADSFVNLKVLRGDQVLDFRLRRKLLKWDPVGARLLPDKTGLLHIKSFVAATPESLKEKIQTLKAQGANKWIVDLRDNEGGSLQAGKKTASLLLKKDQMIATGTNAKGQVKSFKTSGGPVLSQKDPVLVLINSYTRSFSEFLALALKHHRGAVLLGQPSKGKWSAQVIEQLPNGWAAKFTTLQLVGADGKTRKNQGLTPDFTIEFPEDTSFTALAVARRASRVERWLQLDPQLRAGYKMLSSKP